MGGKASAIPRLECTRCPVVILVTYTSLYLDRCCLDLLYELLGASGVLPRSVLVHVTITWHALKWTPLRCSTSSVQRHLLMLNRLFSHILT
jgi:hypothetical protein